MTNKDCFYCKYSCPISYNCEEYLCKHPEKNSEGLPQIVQAPEERDCKWFVKDEVE